MNHVFENILIEIRTKQFISAAIALSHLEEISIEDATRLVQKVYKENFAPSKRQGVPEPEEIQDE